MSEDVSGGGEKGRSGAMGIAIEQESMSGVWETLAEFALDGSIAGADASQNLAENGVDIGDFGESGVVPVMEKQGAFADELWAHADVTGYGGCVEGDVVEPEAVDGAAQTAPLGGCE